MYADSANFSDVELDEIRTLSDLFLDLGEPVVRSVYLENDRDYRATQHALAELATNPSAAAQRVQLPASTSAAQQAPIPLSSDSRSRSQGVLTSGVAATGLAALAMQPAPSDDGESAGSYLPTLPSFDMNTLSETISQVGTTVSDGITSFATNLTGWVADLASAFDASWGLDGEEGDERPVQVSDKNEPAVGYGSGLGIERPYQRRLASAQSSDRHTRLPQPEPEQEEDEDDDWEDEGYTKDD